jgi:ribosome-associated translation inhibitor RaiA
MIKNIEFVGLNVLKDGFEKNKIIKSAENFYEKNIKKFKKIDFLKIHFKALNVEGFRKQFQVDLMLGIAGKEFNSHSKNWIALKAVLECMEKLEKELNKKFKK